MPAPKPVKLFFCYAPEDETLCKELEKHLALLERQGYITSWASRHVGAGADHRAAVKREMAAANVILLLVSADFLASDDVYDVELDQALVRREHGAHVLGVLLRPSDWKHGKLQSLEMLPREAGREAGRTAGRVLAVTSWPSHDTAFSQVAEVLRAKLRDWGYVSRISLNPSEAHPRPAPRG
jgi:hypothetical protein